MAYQLPGFGTSATPMDEEELKKWRAMAATGDKGAIEFVQNYEAGAKSLAASTNNPLMQRDTARAFGVDYFQDLSAAPAWADSPGLSDAHRDYFQQSGAVLNASGKWSLPGTAGHSALYGSSNYQPGSLVGVNITPQVGADGQLRWLDAAGNEHTDPNKTGAAQSLSAVRFGVDDAGYDTSGKLIEGVTRPAPAVAAPAVAAPAVAAPDAPEEGTKSAQAGGGPGFTQFFSGQPLAAVTPMAASAMSAPAAVPTPPTAAPAASTPSADAALLAYLKQQGQSLNPFTPYAQTDFFKTADARKWMMPMGDSGEVEVYEGAKFGAAQGIVGLGGQAGGGGQMWSGTSNDGKTSIFGNNNLEYQFDDSGNLAGVKFKTADKSAVMVNYKLENGQYMPDFSTARTVAWDTNATNTKIMDLVKGAGFVLGGAMGLNALGQAGFLGAGGTGSAALGTLPGAPLFGAAAPVAEAAPVASPSATAAAQPSLFGPGGTFGAPAMSTNPAMLQTGASVLAEPAISTGAGALTAQQAANLGMTDIVAAMYGAAPGASSLLSPIADATTSAADFAAADAAQLAQQGIGQQQIAETLVHSGLDPMIAQDAAQLAAQGLSEAAISQNLTAAYGVELTGGAGAYIPTAAGNVTGYAAIPGVAESIAQTATPSLLDRVGELMTPGNLKTAVEALAATGLLAGAVGGMDDLLGGDGAAAPDGGPVGDLPPVGTNTPGAPGQGNGSPFDPPGKGGVRPDPEQHLEEVRRAIALRRRQIGARRGRGSLRSDGRQATFGKGRNVASEIAEELLGVLGGRGIDLGTLSIDPGSPELDDFFGLGTKSK